MVKFCQKIGCKGQAIPRGKYCESHRTNKKKERDVEYKENSNITQNNDDILLNRMLLQEQDEEYKKVMQMDIERMNKIEEEKLNEEILKQIEDDIINTKRNNIIRIIEESKNCYKIKFVLHNGTRIQQNFIENLKFNDMYDFIDIYFYDNNIDIKNYIFHTNYPKKEFGYEYRPEFLSDHIKDKNILFYIYNLD